MPWVQMKCFAAVMLGGAAIAAASGSNPNGLQLASADAQVLFGPDGECAIQFKTASDGTHYLGTTCGGSTAADSSSEHPLPLASYRQMSHAQLAALNSITFYIPCAQRPRHTLDPHCERLCMAHECPASEHGTRAANPRTAWATLESFLNESLLPRWRGDVLNLLLLTPKHSTRPCLTSPQVH